MIIFSKVADSTLKADLVFGEVNIQGFVVYGVRVTSWPVYAVNLSGELL